ncbi:hypothetical protein M3Y94_00892100 [Aphelenchoides besseyi]|nr:hypothetical protein M3Y94_00892100 [Aphelenchoides besseyi]
MEWKLTDRMRSSDVIGIYGVLLVLLPVIRFVISVNEWSLSILDIVSFGSGIVLIFVVQLRSVGCFWFFVSGNSICVLTDSSMNVTLLAIRRSFNVSNSRENNQVSTLAIYSFFGAVCRSCVCTVGLANSTSENRSTSRFPYNMHE